MSTSSIGILVPHPVFEIAKDSIVKESFWNNVSLFPTPSCKRGKKESCLHWIISSPQYYLTQGKRPRIAAGEGGQVNLIWFKGLPNARSKSTVAKGRAPSDHRKLQATRIAGINGIPIHVRQFHCAGGPSNCSLCSLPRNAVTANAPKVVEVARIEQPIPRNVM